MLQCSRLCRTAAQWLREDTLQLPQVPSPQHRIVPHQLRRRPQALEQYNLFFIGEREGQRTQIKDLQSDRKRQIQEDKPGGHRPTDIQIDRRPLLPDEEPESLTS